MMTDHVVRSRITKALTDAGLAPSFANAEARLDAIVPCIAVGAETTHTRAGQMAALTAVSTAFKCFGRVLLTGDGLDAPLFEPLPVGRTLGAAATALGARIEASVPCGVTHLIRFGHPVNWMGWQVSGW